MPEKTIYFTPNKNDEYFRKSVELTNADVVLQDDQKMSGVVERLSATTLKAIQDQLFSLARQKELKDTAALYSEQLFERYRTIFIEKQTERFRNTPGELKHNTEFAKARAEALFDKKSDQIKRCAIKEAWRTTIRSSVTDDELRFQFNAKSVTDYARVSCKNTKKLYEDVKRMQKKFHNWNEKFFDEKTGEIVDRELNIVLFPVSEYVRAGTGGENLINLKLEKDLLHCVLFLSQSYLKFHLDSYLKLEHPNVTRMYELLVNSANNLFSDEGHNVDALQRKFGTNYAKGSEFLRQVVEKSIEQINKKLGCSIKWHVVCRRGRKIETIGYDISEADKAVLNGVKLGNSGKVEISEEISDELALSFPYFIMLEQIAAGSEIAKPRAYAEKINELIVNGDFDFGHEGEEMAYARYEQNLEAIDEIEGLLEEHEFLGSEYYFDKTLLVVRRASGDSWIGRNAIECLEVLEREKIEPFRASHPSLPGFDAPVNAVKTIEDFLPFRFMQTSKRSISVTSENFRLHQTMLDRAVSQKRLEKFVFETEEERKEFSRLFMGGAAIEADIVNSYEVSVVDEPEHIAEKVYNFFRSHNDRMRTTAEDWRGATDEVLHHYTPDDIAALLQFYTTKDGRFLFQHVGTPSKFTAKFDEHFHAMKASGTAAPGGLPGHANIYNALGEKE